MGVKLAGPIALLFPGQGVQKPGMGRNLYERYPAARRAFERAEEVLDMPVRRLCFDGPLEELNRTDIIQPWNTGGRLVGVLQLATGVWLMYCTYTTAIHLALTGA